MEKYLNCINNNKYRTILTKFRVSAHCLAIETGRYNGTAREDRLCTVCNMCVPEDEYHMLLTCPLYSEMRRQYFTALFFARWPSMNKFDQLMSISSKQKLNNLGKFLYLAFLRRNTILNQHTVD